jgi:O-antigen/teichoic acid export membrane protein
MDKIYCSNCNAEVTQDIKSCPVCGASLKTTAAVPKPTYTLSDYSIPTKQLEEIKNIQISYVALGILLTGLGFYLTILFPKLAPIVGVPMIIGVGFVLRGLGIRNGRNRRKAYLEDTEGGRTVLAGIIILLSSLILGFLAYALGAILFAIVLGGLLFLVGLVCLVIGAALVTSERLKET